MNLSAMQGAGAPDIGLQQGGMISPAMLQQMRMLRYLRDMQAANQSQSNPQNFM
jgi:hypothetical protein